MCSFANTGGDGALQPAVFVNWPFDPPTIAEELIQ
jgi:hypothetical protein